MALIFRTASCVCQHCVSQGLLYIGPNIIFGCFFSDMYLPFLRLSLAHLHEDHGRLALARNSEPVLGSWDLGELPAVLQCAGNPFFSRTPATLNSVFLLPASFRIQYSGVLCCEHRHTPLGVLAHPHFYKPLKETRPKAERAADASQMLGLASCAS